MPAVEACCCAAQHTWGWEAARTFRVAGITSALADTMTLTRHLVDDGLTRVRKIQMSNSAQQNRKCGDLMLSAMETA